MPVRSFPARTSRAIRGSAFLISPITRASVRLFAITSERAQSMRFLPLWLLLVSTACSLLAPSNGPYLVYFQQRSAQLDAPARSLIAEAAQRASAEPAAQVTVAGYTDSAGSPPADVALSQQRAQVVADALIADGVAANRIARTGRGQTGGDPGVASRRVEITIGGV